MRQRQRPDDLRQSCLPPATWRGVHGQTHVQVRDLAVRGVNGDDRVAEPLLALRTAAGRRTRSLRQSAVDWLRKERANSQPRLGNSNSPVLQAEQLPVERLPAALGNLGDDAGLAALARSLDERPFEEGADVGHRQQRRQEGNDLDRVELGRVPADERERRLHEELRWWAGRRAARRRVARDEVDPEKDEKDASFGLGLVHGRAVPAASVEASDSQPGCPDAPLRPEANGRFSLVERLQPLDVDLERVLVVAEPAEEDRPGLVQVCAGGASTCQSERETRTRRLELRRDAPSSGTKRSSRFARYDFDDRRKTSARS